MGWGCAVVDWKPCAILIEIFELNCEQLGDIGCQVKVLLSVAQLQIFTLYILEILMLSSTQNFCDWVYLDVKKTNICDLLYQITDRYLVRRLKLEEEVKLR